MVFNAFLFMTLIFLKMLDFQRHLFDVLEKVLDNQNEILRRFQPIVSGNDHQIIF
jgi:hypothetical protein